MSTPYRFLPTNIRRKYACPGSNKYGNMARQRRHHPTQHDDDQRHGDQDRNEEEYIDEWVQAAYRFGGGLPFRPLETDTHKITWHTIVPPIFNIIRNSFAVTISNLFEFSQGLDKRMMKKLLPVMILVILAMLPIAAGANDNINLNSRDSTRVGCAIVATVDGVVVSNKKNRGTSLMSLQSKNSTKSKK